MSLTPENIVAELERYVALWHENSIFDLKAGTGQPHDVGQGIFAEMQLKRLEDELLHAGIWRATADEVITWARRPE